MTKEEKEREIILRDGCFFFWKASKMLRNNCKVVHYKDTENKNTFISLIRDAPTGNAGDDDFN